MEDIELLDGASEEFDMEQVRNGKLSPVFFGSALTNFGVQPFLESFLDMTTSPLPRICAEGSADPFDEEFSAFVFKIQANMNKAHRDRLTFMRKMCIRDRFFNYFRIFFLKNICVLKRRL